VESVSSMHGREKMCLFIVYFFSRDYTDNGCGFVISVLWNLYPLKDRFMGFAALRRHRVTFAWWFLDRVKYCTISLIFSDG
jgi:hypothetical protein